MCDDQGVTAPDNAFKGFLLDRVLREDKKNKLITVVGKFEHDSSEEALVIVERLPPDQSFLSDSFSSPDTATVETLKNDIYTTHSVHTPKLLPDCKATMIYPATAKHIAKWSEHEPFIIRETAELYKTVTRPCLESSKFSIQWVHNILEKKSEVERIIFEDPEPKTGFVLLPDMKWDPTDKEALYLQAIVHPHSVQSLRSLTADHLPLLTNILEKGKKAILDKYRIDESKLRIYLHYQPSYSHLHVHFTHVKLDAPGSDCLRAHILEDIIENLQMDPDYYTKKTLLYVVRENDDLFKAFKSAGYFTQ